MIFETSSALMADVCLSDHLISEVCGLLVWEKVVDEYRIVLGIGGLMVSML